MTFEKIQSHAKINLFLDVLSKRKDGYHDIYSLISKIDLYDEIEIEKSNSLEIIFEGQFSSMIKLNAIEQLFEYLFQKNYLPEFPFKIKIQKNIPVGAGLGGGSSNIASLLMHLINNKLINEDQCLKTARELGSDIEFFFERKPSFIIGKGLVDRSINIICEKQILLVYPFIDLSTEAVFRNNKSFVKKSDINENATSLELEQILHVTSNNLETSSINLCSQINLALDFLRNHKNCQFARMTGSGSCVFALLDNEFEASKVTQDINSKFPDWWTKITKLI